MSQPKEVTRRGIRIDLSFEHKTHCPRCLSKGQDNSEDNLHVYGLDSEGKHLGAYCFACEYAIASEEFAEENQEDQEESFEIMAKDFGAAAKQEIKEKTGTASKGYRGIRDDVSKRFKMRYQYSEEDGKVIKSFYPTTKQGKLVGFKVRIHPKDWDAYGETGRNCDFFGQHEFKTYKGILLIVGGEVDCLSAFQMLLDSQKDKRFDPIAVISPTNGESSAHRQATQQYEFLNQFKKIVVCMDNDEKGKEAAEKLCGSLPRGKVSVMDMRLKDPNKYLEEGREKEFVSDFWNARPYTPAGVHGSSTLYQSVLEYADMEQLTLPNFLNGAQQLFKGGLVKNEITCIFADTSIGKSLFVDSCFVHWVENEPGEKLGALSLEATKDKWATSILSNYLGVRLIELSKEERKEYLSRPDVQEKANKFLKTEDGEDRFYVCDERGAGLDVVKEKILEMIIHLGVTVLIIDVYSDLMDGLSLEEQEKMVAWLKKLIKEYPQVSIVMVCHTRKRQQGVKQALQESDIIGTSTIMKSAAQTISLERDKQAESTFLRNCTRVTVHKNRHFSRTGPAGVVYFDIVSGRLYDLDDYLLEHPEMEEEAQLALGE